MARRLNDHEIAIIAAQWKTGKWKTYAALAKHYGCSDKTVRRCVLDGGLTPVQGRELKTHKPCACHRDGCVVERREGEHWHRFRDRKYRTPECRPDRAQIRPMYIALDHPQGGTAFLHRLEAVHGRWKGRPYLMISDSEP